MCMTCGCGKVNEDHGNPDNITLADMEKAAEAGGVTVDEAVTNIGDAYELQGAGEA